jgi:hypothetical protein
MEIVFATSFGKGNLSKHEKPSAVRFLSVEGEALASEGFGY